MGPPAHQQTPLSQCPQLTGLEPNRSPPRFAIGYAALLHPSGFFHAGSRTLSSQLLKDRSWPKASPSNQSGLPSFLLAPAVLVHSYRPSCSASFRFKATKLQNSPMATLNPRFPNPVMLFSTSAPQQHLWSWPSPAPCPAQQPAPFPPRLASPPSPARPPPREPGQNAHRPLRSSFCVCPSLVRGQGTVRRHLTNRHLQPSLPPCATDPGSACRGTSLWDVRGTPDSEHPSSREVIGSLKSASPRPHLLPVPHSDHLGTT